jgi:hypothetical protein
MLSLLLSRPCAHAQQTLDAAVRANLNATLPADVAARCSGRGFVAVTRAQPLGPDPPLVLGHRWASRDSLISAGGRGGGDQLHREGGCAGRAWRATAAALSRAHAQARSTIYTHRMYTPAHARPRAPRPRSRRVQLPALLVGRRPLRRPRRPPRLRRRLHRAPALPARRCARARARL